MLFDWFKKKRPVGALSPSQILSDLQSDKLPCRHCGRQLDTQSVRPLESIVCECGNRMAVAPRTLGSFILFEFVDQGGMGLVYRAVSHQYPDETFAVKVLHQDHPESDRGDALMNEARHIRKFEGYPHIVQAVEVGEVGDELFFVTEFIEGKRLDQHLSPSSPFSVEKAIDLVLELLRIDKFIWSHGLLYRDLKPENILLRNGKCVLIDFGLCVGLSHAHSARAPEIDGAPHFMPPERLTGEAEGVYSETYSLGMILYYCLLGDTLFPSGEAQAVAERYLSGDRAAPELTGVRGISPELEAIVRKAISLQIPNRYQSFDRLETDLKNVQRLHARSAE